MKFEYKKRGYKNLQRKVGVEMSFLKAMMEKEPPEPVNPIGIVVIGNIEPDMHDTAKEQVRKALKRAGFKTIDAGKSVAPQVFVDKAKENNADIIALSINTVPAKNNLAKLDEALKTSGLKGKVILMMGGAAVKKEDAQAIGALYGKNKEEGVEIAKKAIAGKKK
jgi:methylmalonyl-CoA mutase cobalamin-binding domain/chain